MAIWCNPDRKTMMNQEIFGVSHFRKTRKNGWLNSWPTVIAGARAQSRQPVVGPAQRLCLLHSGPQKPMFFIILIIIDHHMVVSWNRDTPNHPKLDHCSIETHGDGDPSFWDAPLFPSKSRPFAGYLYYQRHPHSEQSMRVCGLLYP